jgi:non-ribosomal peptide synthetase component E (peptide arylation enzyme)
MLNSREPESMLLHELVTRAAERSPHDQSLTAGAQTLTYAALCDHVAHCAAGLIGLGLAGG